MSCDPESEDSDLAVQLTDGFVLKFDIGRCNHDYGRLNTCTASRSFSVNKD